jgi:hypothetical protein
VFTSGNDVNTSAKKPSAGDWKGIFVRGPWADILFDYVKVAYSDSGVVVKAPRDKLNIRATIFKENGGRNLSVNKKYIHIEENYPFTFESLDSAGFVELSSKAPLSSTVQPRGTTHNKLRVGSTITGCTGVIFLAGGIVASMHFKDKYDSAVSTAESDKYRNRIVFSNITALSGGVLALLGGVGFVVSF